MRGCRITRREGGLCIKNIINMYIHSDMELLYIQYLGVFSIHAVKIREKFKYKENKEVSHMNETPIKKDKLSSKFHNKGKMKETHSHNQQQNPHAMKSHQTKT
jgi:hypothetical protein